MVAWLELAVVRTNLGCFSHWRSHNPTALCGLAAEV